MHVQGEREQWEEPSEFTGRATKCFSSYFQKALGGGNLSWSHFENKKIWLPQCKVLIFVQNVISSLYGTYIVTYFAQDNLSSEQTMCLIKHKIKST